MSLHINKCLYISLNILSYIISINIIFINIFKFINILKVCRYKNETEISDMKRTNQNCCCCSLYNFQDIIVLNWHKFHGNIFNCFEDTYKISFHLTLQKVGWLWQICRRSMVAPQTIISRDEKMRPWPNIE